MNEGTAASDATALGPAAAVVGEWGHGADQGDLQTRHLQGADGSLPTGTGPAHEHLDLAHALLESPARCGLGGGLGGEGCSLAAPLKPLAPADDQLITSPAVSVIETIVLLKVLWMWATPLGTLRLAFFGPVFLAGFAMGKALLSQGGDRGTGRALVTPGWRQG